MTLEEEIPIQYGSSTSIASDGKVVAMDLLDEYWFFKNSLLSKKILRRLPSVCSSSPDNKKESAVGRPNQQRDLQVSTPELPSSHRVETPILRRMPTLPPRLRRHETTAAQEEAELPFNSGNPKLLHSCSSLDDYLSTAPSKNASSCRSSARDRPPRCIKIEGSNRYGANQHYIVKEAYYRKSFQEKNWRSLSDLEYIEVQGFKDLGFVFDKEGLNTSLARVIPGLRDKKATMEDAEDKVSRPYLSEAWLLQRSAPPMFRWVNRRSVEDMKEQLRFWAREVACNARQEC